MSIESLRARNSLRGSVIHPGDTLVIPGQFDHWATPLAKDFGMPSLNALASMSMDLTDATGSSADIVRVKISRAPGRAPGRPKPARSPRGTDRRTRRARG